MEIGNKELSSIWFSLNKLDYLWYYSICINCISGFFLYVYIKSCTSKAWCCVGWSCHKSFPLVQTHSRSVVLTHAHNPATNGARNGTRGGMTAGRCIDSRDRRNTAPESQATWTDQDPDRECELHADQGAATHIEATWSGEAVLKNFLAALYWGLLPEWWVTGKPLSTWNLQWVHC